MVSVSVSKIFGFKKSIGIGFEKNWYRKSIGIGFEKFWYRKKYWYRFRKILVSKKIGIGKKFWIRFRSDFGYRHTLPPPCHYQLESESGFESESGKKRSC